MRARSGAIPLAIRGGDRRPRRRGRELAPPSGREGPGPGPPRAGASPDDLVEALERPESPFLAGVQWHPENLVAERRQKAVFGAFLDACRARARVSGRAGDPLVFVSLEGPIAVVKLARPAAGNAFAGDMAEMLADTVAALAEDPTVPAIVLTGLGDSFSRGFDPDLLAALVALGDEQGFAAHLDALGRAAHALASAPRPILAAVDGPALGAGFSLALACDQRIARGSSPHEAVFGLSPFFPALEAGASVFLPLLASSAAADVAFTGERLSAARARELGLVDLVAEDGPALPVALQRAALYAERPIASLAAAKRALASRDRLARLEDGLPRERESALASLPRRDARRVPGFFADHPGPPAPAGGSDRPQ